MTEPTWDEEIVEILDELTLNPLQWETLLNTIKLLDKREKISVHYIHQRFNIGNAITDSVINALMRLGWGYFSLGYVVVSKQAQSDFDKLKTLVIE